MTMTFLRKSIAPLMRNAVWLWSTTSHQCRGTNSARTTTVGRVGSPSSIASRYLRKGRVIARYGETMTSSSVEISVGGDTFSVAD